MTTENAYLDYFDDAESVKTYSADPPKFVPGFYDMHRMACVLMSESVPEQAHILVHGAGGGLELKSFAEFNEQWTFLGVDPAAPMIAEAQRNLGTLNERITLHHGLIYDVPVRKLDAATSILTLHVLDAEERLRTVSEIVKRLKPGAPFIAVHCSFPQDQRQAWLNRHQDYTSASGISPELSKAGRATVENTLPILSPEADEDILRASGLKDINLFYAAFIWRGWVGYA